MGALDEVMKADGVIFVDPDAFGETVTYKPRFGVSRPIQAVVVRGQPNTVEESGRAFAPSLEAFIRNDQTLGVLKVDTGGDKITVAARIGGPAADHTVSEVLSQDRGMWHVRLR